MTAPPAAGAAPAPASAGADRARGQYAGKAPSYFVDARAEIDVMLPARMERVLDVGCGTGAALARLRRTHGVRWAGGVELVPAAAAEARAHLDAVWEGDVEELAPPVPPGSLDLVLCLDVLEHLRDPWAAAARLAGLLRPGGALVASLPNAQHYSVSLPLLVGRHPFEASGLRDRTHLHPFVRATAVELVAGAGLRVDRVQARLGRRVRAVDALTFGALRGLFTVQYFVRGVRPG